MTTEEAWEITFDKWYRLATDEGLVCRVALDIEEEPNCGLCLKFFRKGCCGCPIHEYTYYPNCVNTPFDIWFSEGISTETAVMEWEFLVDVFLHWCRQRRLKLYLIEHML